MENNIATQPTELNLIKDDRFAWLNTVESYFFYAEKDFQKFDFDALIYWTEDSRAFRLYWDSGPLKLDYDHSKGEWFSTEPMPDSDKVKQCVSIEKAEYSAMIEKIVRMGILDASPQLHNSVLSNIDAAWGIRTSSETEDKWIFAYGGIHKDERMKKVKTWVFRNNHEFFADED